RIAYLSADFHDHATAWLAAGMFEAHDRSRFETTALSLSRAGESEMCKRLRLSFERFVDVSSRTDHQTPELIRQMEIDILVDLKGFTGDARTGILALRPAPIQVNYLGYPGTMAAPYIDYIVADRWVIPSEHHGSYSEKIAYLPESYQANDDKRSIG